MSDTEKKLDELIEKTCDYITDLQKSKTGRAEVAENTKALAELVSARAQMLL